MFEELSDILKGKVDPAVWAGVSEITAALEKHQAVQWKERVSALRMDANNHEAATVVDEAIQIIYDQVRALLQQMQISLELDTMPMYRLAGVLDALCFAPSDYDSEALAALEAGEDSVDVFCDIMAIYVNCIPEELMEFVVEVSGNAVTAMAEKLSQNVSYTELPGDGVQDTVRLMNRHQQLVGTVLTVGMESLQGGMTVGGEMRTLVEANRTRLADLEPTSLVDELLSLAILAKTPYDALQDEVMHFVEAIVDDPFHTQKAYKRVQSRLSALPEHTP